MKCLSGLTTAFVFGLRLNILPLGSPSCPSPCLPTPPGCLPGLHPSSSRDPPPSTPARHPKHTALTLHLPRSYRKLSRKSRGEDRAPWLVIEQQLKCQWGCFQSWVRESVLHTSPHKEMNCCVSARLGIPGGGQLQGDWTTGWSLCPPLPLQAAPTKPLLRGGCPGRGEHGLCITELLRSLWKHLLCLTAHMGLSLPIPCWCEEVR